MLTMPYKPIMTFVGEKHIKKYMFVNKMTNCETVNKITNYKSEVCMYASRKLMS